MRYYKMIEDGYVAAIGTGWGYTEITEEEYNHILGIIQSCPEAEAGYQYLLKEDMTWELVEAPVEVPRDDEITEADLIAALAELGVAV